MNQRLLKYPGELAADLRYGMRTLAGSPGFTTVALLSLTLGIAIATSAFSELNGFLLRDVPGVVKPAELITVPAPVSYPDYKRYRDANLFSGIFAYVAPVPFGIATGSRKERIWGHLVTESYFSTLGVRARLVRTFDPEQDGKATHATVVISDRFWRNQLGGDPAVIGKTLHVNGRPCAVAGIAPADFQGASPMVYNADLWMLLSAAGGIAPELSNHALERPDLAIFHVVARLRPGVHAAQAEAALDTIVRHIERERGDAAADRTGQRVHLLPGGKLLPVRKQDLPVLTGFFFVLGGVILLIAAFNLTNMLLARAVDRRREIAVRLALGAGRGRLVRQLLTETALLATLAGALGFLAATWLMHLASQEKLPYPMPLTFHLEPDGRVLSFTIGLTLFTAIVFGLAPALRATRTDLAPALKQGSDVLALRSRRLSLRNLLMVAQTAASLALLLITGFLVIGHRRISDVDVGFNARNLHLISLDPVRDGYTGEQAALFFHRLLDRMRNRAAIQGASLADAAPMTMIGKPGVPVLADTATGSKSMHSARKYVVGDDFFKTMDIPILRGRDFRKEDEQNDASAVIVSEKLAKECWPGGDALGKRIEIGNEDVPGFTVGTGTPRGMARMPRAGRLLEVVGVAKDIRDGLNMVAADAPAVVYLPLRQADYNRSFLQGITLLLRTSPGAEAGDIVRREVSAIDERVTPFNIRRMPEQIEELMFPVKVALWTYGCIGITGLILACVGLAGVTSYTVSRRRREIGIRVALGAGEADVLGLVMKESAALVLVGTAIGLCWAWAAIRVLSGLMAVIARTAGTSTSDPALLAGAPLLLAVLALVMCYFPARKSIRIDPAVALRQD